MPELLVDNINLFHDNMKNQRMFRMFKYLLHAGKILDGEFANDYNRVLLGTAFAVSHFKDVSKLIFFINI